MKPFSLPKSERLTRESQIKKLFQEGASIKSNPVRLIYNVEMPSEDPGLKIMVTVPSKKFKKAVIRNRIKRMMREAYRQNKPEIANGSIYSLHIAFVYTGDKPDVTYKEIERGVVAGLNILVLTMDTLK